MPKKQVPEEPASLFIGANTLLAGKDKLWHPYSALPRRILVGSLIAFCLFVACGRLG